MNEVKIRVPVSFHRAINLAAARRGVAASALVAQVVYEYLHARGELAPTQADTKPTPALDQWLDDDDGPLNVGS